MNKYTQRYRFLQIFFWSSNFKVIIQRKVTKLILVLRPRHWCLENQVSSHCLFSDKSNTELFPKPQQLQSPKPGLFHRNRCWSSTPLEPWIQLRVKATDITPYLPYSIYYIRLFQILLEMLSLWAKKKEKSHRDAKKKNESSTSKRQTFFLN